MAGLGFPQNPGVNPAGFGGGGVLTDTTSWNPNTNRHTQSSIYRPHSTVPSMQATPNGAPPSTSYQRSVRDPFGQYTDPSGLRGDGQPYHVNIPQSVGQPSTQPSQNTSRRHRNPLEWLRGRPRYPEPSTTDTARPPANPTGSAYSQAPSTGPLASHPWWEQTLQQPNPSSGYITDDSTIRAPHYSTTQQQSAQPYSYAPHYDANGNLRGYVGTEPSSMHPRDISQSNPTSIQSIPIQRSAGIDTTMTEAPIGGLTVIKDNNGNAKYEFDLRTFCTATDGKHFVIDWKDENGNMTGGVEVTCKKNGPGERDRFIMDADLVQSQATDPYNMQSGATGPTMRNTTATQAQQSLMNDINWHIHHQWVPGATEPVPTGEHAGLKDHFMRQHWSRMQQQNPHAPPELLVTQISRLADDDVRRYLASQAPTTSALRPTETDALNDRWTHLVTVYNRRGRPGQVESNFDAASRVVYEYFLPDERRPRLEGWDEVRKLQTGEQMDKWKSLDLFDNPTAQSPDFRDFREAAVEAHTTSLASQYATNDADIPFLRSRASQLVDLGMIKHHLTRTNDGTRDTEIGVITDKQKRIENDIDRSLWRADASGWLSGPRSSLANWWNGRSASHGVNPRTTTNSFIPPSTLPYGSYGSYPPYHHYHPHQSYPPNQSYQSHQSPNPPYQSYQSYRTNQPYQPYPSQY